MSSNKQQIQDLIKKLNDDLAFDIDHETAMIQIRILSEVDRLMETHKISKKSLAEKIGTSSSYITQLFRGSKKLNLETMAKFQNAFSIKFDVRAVEYIIKDLDNENDDISYQPTFKIRKLKPTYEPTYKVIDMYSDTEVKFA